MNKEMGKSRRLILLFLLALVLVPGKPAFGTDESAAIVCYLEGKAWVYGQEGEKPSPLGLFDWIKEGSFIRTDKGSQIVIALVSGERFELKEKSKVKIIDKKIYSVSGSVKKLPPVSVMPQIASIAKKARPGTRMGGIRLRGKERTIRGLYPSDGAAVPADNAVMTFIPLDDAERYRLEIEDELGNNILSVETRAPKVTVSPGILKPGAVYNWEIRSLEEKKPAAVSYGAFSTLSSEHARIWSKFRENTIKSGDPAELLLLVQLEKSLMMHREACETLKTAASHSPENEEIKKAMSECEWE